jgi:DHA1 family tetracycline resistance protein-like MFS transporter
MASMSVPEDQTVKGDSSWRRWVEPWYLGYALLGASAAGLAPILLPLMVSKTGNAAQVGLVMAAFSLGGLAAPLWGVLADRYRLHRPLMASGLLAVAAGAAVFPFAGSLAAWMGLAFVQSLGAAAAATVANLFVVEAHPRLEWDARIGWLQTFYGGGQVAGLVVAGLLAAVSLHLGLWVTAGLAALAVLPGWLTARTPPAPGGARPVLRHPLRHGEWPAASPQRLYHHLTAPALRGLGRSLASPFGIFLAAWLLSFSGAAVIFALYPVLMQQAFGVAPVLSSQGFALAAGLGLFLYSPAGTWSGRSGPASVLRAGLGLRLAAGLGLVLLELTHFGPGWLALAGFLVIVLAWSLLSVSSTAWAAQLSPVGEGEGLGIFNAVTALASVIGAAFGGWVASSWGYTSALSLAAGGVASGLAITFALRQTRTR